MQILGIDYDKCSSCGTCVFVCPRVLFEDTGGNKIEYNDPKAICIRCGHCIARCPEDAVRYEDMGESHEFEGLNKNNEIISFDEMYKFLQAHRSIRRYKKEKVSNELLEKVFNAMQYAPTGRNMRSEFFVLISDQEQLKSLSDAVQETLTNDKAWGWVIWRKACQSR